MQHCLTAIAKAWSLNRDALESATDLVHNQSREGFTFNVFGDDHEWLSALHDLFKDRQYVFHC